MTLDELRTDLRELLDDALPALEGERAPLQAERVACLVALPVTELEGAAQVIVEELEGRGSPEAADLLGAMGRLHPEPLGSVARAAAGRLGNGRAFPELEVRRVVRVDDGELTMLAADVRADGGAFALTLAADDEALDGGLGAPGTPEAVAQAVDELAEAVDVYPRAAAEHARTLLERAGVARRPASEDLVLDGPLVVHALGLPPEAWPDLPLLVEDEVAPELEPEPSAAVPPRPPRDAARKKAQRRNQKAARKRNR